VVTRSHYGRPKAYSISASLRSNPPIGRSSSLLPGVIGGVGRCFISRPIMIAQLADVGLEVLVTCAVVARRHHGHFANESRSGTLYIVPGMKSSIAVVSVPFDLTRTW
jgi:hypothetical protein